MQRLIFILSLFFAGQALAVDAYVPCTGASCKVIVAPHTSGNAATSVQTCQSNGCSFAAGVSVTKSDVATTGTINALDVSGSSFIRFLNATVTLNGIAANGLGYNGRRVILTNATGATITINHLNGSANASDQFNLPNATAYLLPDRASVEAIYDSSGTNWRLVSLNGFETGTGFTAAFAANSSGNQSGSLSITYTLVGDEVTLSIPAVAITTTTADQALTSNSTLPAKVTPSSDRWFAVRGQSGGTTQGAPIALRITSGGAIAIYKDMTSTATYAAGTSGTTNTVNVTYKL